MCLLDSRIIGVGDVEGRLMTVRAVARPPTPSSLAALDEADRAALGVVLRRANEALYYRFFKSARAERALGSDAFCANEEHPERAWPCCAKRRQLLAAGLVRLTYDEERFTFLKYNYCRYRVLRLIRAHAGRRLTTAAARQLLRWERAATACREVLVGGNRPLVMAMLGRARLDFTDMQDLIAEGNLALIQSVNRFDALRGFRFSTYACRSILSAFSRSRKRTARRRRLFPTEFDQTADGSLYTACDAPLPEDREEHVELTEALRDRLSVLTPREFRVLRYRFGLAGGDGSDGGREQSLRDIAHRIGLSTERVRQIQNEALAKLREALPA